MDAAAADGAASVGVGARLSPTGGGRVYASPTHLRGGAVCPSSNHHVYCDKYDTAVAGGGHWFADASTGGQRLCWNQTLKFLPPTASDDELIACSAHEPPYALDRNWTAVAGSDAAVNL